MFEKDQQWLRPPVTGITGLLVLSTCASALPDRRNTIRKPPQLVDSTIYVGKGISLLVKQREIRKLSTCELG
jgi:hypothetical protein